MQRTAQDWLVLAELTHHRASAAGIVMGLQFGPQLLFLPWSGYAADHLDRLKLLRVTQAVMAALAILLGVLVISHRVELWHVYAIAFLYGSAAAFDAPARQTFVSDLVAQSDLPNAVALNSASFNAARMVGPAVAGLSIAAWGSGWAIVANGISFLFVLGSLSLIKLGQRPTRGRRPPLRGNLADGFRYIMARRDLRTAMIMIVVIGTFGLNFPIFIATMSLTVFGRGAGSFGLLTSIMAVGTITGALLAAGRNEATPRILVVSAAAFGCGLALAAAMPSYWLFAAMMAPIGVATQTFTNSSNTLMQLATDPGLRGRVMAIRLAALTGVTLVGAPLTGIIADRLGPRAALAVGASACLICALVGMRQLIEARTAPADPVL